MDPCSDYRRAVDELLERVAPNALLAIGAPARQLAAAYGDRHSDCRVTRLEPMTAFAALPRHGTHDLALLDGHFAALEPAQIRHLVAALRDIYARRMLAVVSLDADGGWNHRQMIGLGLSGIGRHAAASAAVELFQFDIATYKTTPDWLNSRHWAHPGLFDKHRW